jgi:hypothetical protein
MKGALIISQYRVGKAARINDQASFMAKTTCRLSQGSISISFNTISDQWKAYGCIVDVIIPTNLVCALFDTAIPTSSFNFVHLYFMLSLAIIRSPNLTPLLERMSWDSVKWRMDIPRATVDMICSSGGDDSQHRRRCWEVYLNDHPAPSWKQVADALYRPSLLDKQEHLEEFEVVQKKYLRGESEEVML